jgi:D-alanyl-D-alanine carboxypeptidase/D-alanyl-D-alanine-endopeptidase (penicillin-binding protein 4)
MRSWFGTVRCAASLAALLVISAVAGAQPLRERLDAVIGSKRSLESATVGVHVRDIVTGKELFERNGEAALIPASNMKLLTTGAALRVLGPDHVFETRIGWAGDRIVVIGDGDPGLGDPALLDESSPPTTVDQMLDTLAAALADAPSAKPTASGILIDDRVFDRQLVSPSWPVDQLNRWYCAEVSGLNFHTNCLSFFFSGDSDEGLSAGSRPGVRLQPVVEGVGDWVSIANKGKVVAQGRHTTWVARAAGARPANEYTVFGNVRLDGSSMVDVAVHDPSLFFGRLLAERVEARGVAIARDGDGRGARVERAASDAEGFEPAVVVRTAMSDVLRRANTNSQNLYTEALIKRVGHEVTREPGSWSNGGSVVRMLLAEDLGPTHATKTIIDDGSGMSRENRVAPETLTAWLSSLARRPAVGPAMIASLPEPGDGTLRRRFRDAEIRNDVRAKSGTINGVRCLSGYVLTPDGSAGVSFSVLINDIEHGSQIRDALALHEEVVEAIDEWLATIAPAAEPAFGG